MKIKDPDVDLPVGDIVKQMNEPMPLPMGRAEFEDWADRIISGALIPSAPGQEELLKISQKFALAEMIMHIGPRESHKPDAYFIHALRKVVSNQVALEVMKELKEAHHARMEAQLLENLSEAERDAYTAAKALGGETLKRVESV